MPQGCLPLHCSPWRARRSASLVDLPEMGDLASQRLHARQPVNGSSANGVSTAAGLAGPAAGGSGAAEVAKGRHGTTRRTPTGQHASRRAAATSGGTRSPCTRPLHIGPHHTSWRVAAASASAIRPAPTARSVPWCMLPAAPRETHGGSFALQLKRQRAPSPRRKAQSQVCRLRFAPRDPRVNHRRKLYVRR